MTKQCEGWRRSGGAFSFGPVKWEQCKKDAVVELVVIQDKKETTIPSCMICWDKAMGNDKIKIKHAEPLS